MAMLQWQRVATPEQFLPCAGESITVVANKVLYVIGGRHK